MMLNEDEQKQKVAEIGALPAAPLEMPVQVLETPMMREVMQSGGVFAFVLRQVMPPRQAAKAGH